MDATATTCARFWRGDEGLLGALATRLAGSSDLYQPGGRQPYHSINFITSHDGFTLNDLHSYADKHNAANGEGNRDGDNNNHSSNYGIEGPTDRVGIKRLRERQIRNHLATLLLSQGVPMLLSGDECRRTQHGNNNAYCQDNETSWFDWRLTEDHADLVRFTRAVVAFRRRQPTVRRREFFSGKTVGPRELADVSWFNAVGTAVDWCAFDKSLMCLFAAPGLTEDPEGSWPPRLAADQCRFGDSAVRAAGHCPSRFLAAFRRYGRDQSLGCLSRRGWTASPSDRTDQDGGSIAAVLRGGSSRGLTRTIVAIFVPRGSHTVSPVFLIRRCFAVRMHRHQKCPINS